MTRSHAPDTCGLSRRNWLTSSAALALTGAAGSFGTPIRAQTISPLRIGIIPVDSAGAAVFARDMGFFAKTGIDATIQAIQAGSAIAAAVASGSLDIGWSAVDVIAVLHSKNIPITIVAPGAEYVGAATERTTGLLVALDSPIRNAKDLNGKIVATNALHSFLETNVRAWSDKNGGDSSTIKFVELPLPTMAAALDSGRVDAVGLLEPFLSGAAPRHRVVFYGYPGIGNLFLTSAYFTSTQWANDHPDLLRRFQTSIRDAASWSARNRARSDALLAQFTKLNPDVVASMAHSKYGERVTPALLQPVIDASAKYNGYKAFPAEELIYAGPH